MILNHLNLKIIFLDTLLVSSLVIAGVLGCESCSDNQDSKKKRGEPNDGPKLSSPVECARQCVAGEPPKICYYHFTAENYVVGGSACELCTPNATNALEHTCQCVTADGVERTIVTINRMLPGPSIQVCRGDKVVIDVHNKMEGMELAIHWHGIWQNGSQCYDGVPYVTQCPILQGNTFRYQWIAENAGTHFWHSHTGLQKLDGIYGNLIVREPPSEDPNSHLYDKDLPTHVLLIGDWMHQGAVERFPGLLGPHAGQVAEAVLINGKGQYTSRSDNTTTRTPLAIFEVKYGYRYRFRMINSMCTVCPAQLNIQNHSMKVIATDGETVHNVKVNTILSFAGERYDFIINANQAPGTYWIHVRALGECGEHEVQQFALLRYKGGPEMPDEPAPTYAKGFPNGVILNPLDAICNVPRKDAICVSQLKHMKKADERLLQKPDIQLFLRFSFHTYDNKILYKPGNYDHFLTTRRRAAVEVDIDGISFQPPASPLISQLKDIPKEKICNGNNRPAECGSSGPCNCVHRIDIPCHSMVEIITVDERVPGLSHPFHLHGYAFTVVGIGRSPYKNVTKMSLQHARDLNEKGLLNRNLESPARKDTIAVPNNGYTVLRFIADNPGEWIFHCHFVYHIPVGMDVVLSVTGCKNSPPIPKDFPKCGNFLPPIEHISKKSNKYQ